MAHCEKCSDGSWACGDSDSPCGPGGPWQYAGEFQHGPFHFKVETREMNGKCAAKVTPTWIGRFWGLGLADAGVKVDIVTLIWLAVFGLWGWATLHNFLVAGTFQLADLPTGLASVLVAVPLFRGAVEAARALSRGGRG